MTIHEKFSKGIVVYKNENDDYILELWGSSTKHPDSLFRYSDWENKSNMFSTEDQIFQWLLYCASQLTFPFFARSLVDYAIENWYNWD